MAQHEEEVEQDLSHIHWSWPEAIAANPARSLATPDLAMDYFAYSPFFDSKSNNSVLRTQRRVENPTYGHAEEKVELNAFRSGFEYVVAHSQPPDLFVIHRREVQPDGSRENVSAAYFILQDKVYPTPTLYDVMATRLKNAAHLIANTFSTLSHAHPPANPRAQSSWRSLPPSVTRETQDGARIPVTGSGQASEGEMDVDMDPIITNMAEPATTGDSTPTGAAVAKNREGGKGKIGGADVPDWFLFNALASTRAAMDEMDNLARTRSPGIDAEEELRALEAPAGRGRGSERGGALSVQRAQGKVWPTGTLEVGSKQVQAMEGVQAKLDSPLVVRQRGRTGSITMSGGGVGSPLAGVWGAS